MIAMFGVNGIQGSICSMEFNTFFQDAVAKKATPVATDTGSQPKQSIVRKWYFWVAVVAIAASVGAVTGIAVKAARDDKPDALDRRGVFGVATPKIRF